MAVPLAFMIALAVDRDWQPRQEGLEQFVRRRFPQAPRPIVAEALELIAGPLLARLVA